MKRTSIVFYLILISMLVITGCSGETPPDEAEQSAQQVDQAPQGVPVEVAQVETGDISLIYRYSGNLEAKDDINIMPGAVGEIEILLVEVGDVVEEGDPIAIIERDTYQAQLKQAQSLVRNAELQLAKMSLGSRPAEIATAQAAVELARAALDDTAQVDDNERTRAAAELARTQAALRKAQADYDKIAWAGDVGESQEAVALEQATISYENALANYQLDTNIGDAVLAPLMVNLAQAELNLALTLEPYREIDFEIAKASIEQAKVGVEIAQLALDETIIEAPFDGIIAELYIAEGSTVNQQVPVARFVTQEKEVEINVEESRIGHVQKGQYAAIRVPAFPNLDFPAIVTTISPVANEETRTFSVKVVPQDDEGLLKSGMFANVSLLVEEKEDTTVAPLTSITLTENDEQVVYVVDQANKVQQRVITTGISDNERVEVLEGLQPGDTVVVVGQRNLSDEALVEVVSGG